MTRYSALSWALMGGCLALGCGSSRSTVEAAGGSSATGSGATGGASGSGCPSGQSSCGDGCVSLEADNAHCGSCDVACATGQSCQEGFCQCLGALQACSEHCVDTQSDPSHCGGCGIACSVDQVCSAGACSDDCGAGLTQCGAACVDLTSNLQHCGDCDSPCTAGQACAAGSCTCASGLSLCDGGCVDTATSAAHCGSCDNQCPAGVACVSGVCAGSGGTGGTGAGGASTGATGGSEAAGGDAAGGSSAGGTATGGSGTGGGAAIGTGPVVRVDFDMAGRSTDEVNEPGYVSWPVEEAATISDSFDGVEILFSSTGPNGAALKSDWYKAGVAAPYYARLVSDGLTVQEGEAGAEITMTLRGLPAGDHTLLVYHNNTANPDNNTFAPVDITVDGALVVDDLVPSVRAESTATTNTSYLEFEAQANQDVVILFAADASSSASNKNVMINGFALNTPNSAKQATDPFPAHGDEHVDADSGALTLSWTAASRAVSHDVYYGESADAVRTADPSSASFMGNQTDTTFPVSELYSMSTYYWRIDEVNADGEVTTGDLWYFRPRQLAFPGAEGYGRFARGGRGGAVVHVTNLNDSGAGSFREAVESDIGPRTIVFDVAGLITLSSRLTLNGDYVTVAGQTAPGKGICIRSAPFGLSGAQDVIVQHVRVRLGAGTTYDGMGMAGSDHAIIDHSSISWTIDEAFSSRSGKNITLQRTLISEALNIAGHANYPEGTAHGYAASISGDIGSFHHNLLAHCYGRNWSLAGGLDGNGDFAGRLDIFNNVVYNWGTRSTDGGAHEVNFVNNYYKPGPATSIFVALNAQYESFPGTQQYYFSGNVMPGRFDESSQGSGRTYE